MCCEEEKDLWDEEYYDGCMELDIIEETIYEYDIPWDYEPDDYWEKGWAKNEDGFFRFDSDGYQDKEYRVFPTRYRLRDFVFTKSLRRILKKNRDLKMLIRPFRPTNSKDKLHTAHHCARHNGKGPVSVKTRFNHLRYSEISVMETSVFDGRKLLACSIFEVGRRSVVSDLAFWDVTEAHRGLGTLTVLLEIQYALRKKKKFYYLGHYLRQDPNFHYKTRFPGLELFDWDHEAWVDYKDPRIKEMFQYRLRCADDDHRFEPEFYISLVQMALDRRENAIGAAVIGAHAHGELEDDWNMRFIIVTTDIEHYFENNNWAGHFTRVLSVEREDHAGFTRMNLKYRSGAMFELNFVSPDWAALPVNDETRRIVTDGMRILHDPQGVLEKLQKTVLDG